MTDEPIDSAFVAGWEDGAGEWHNTEAGGRSPDANDLETSERIVIAATDANGETHYFTTSYLSDDYGIDDAIADLGDKYGIEFA